MIGLKSGLVRALAVCLVAAVASPAVLAQQFTGRVVGVVDGDTVDLLTDRKELVRFRLSGIDAPERRQAFGTVSKMALSDMAFEKRATIVASKKDRYGRFVGKVLVSGADINLKMVRQGWAWHYKKYAREQNEADQRQYDKAESAARAERVGLWQDPNPIAPWEFRLKARPLPKPAS
jgi:endonuclease YncB( thermonuclease family)